MAEPIAGKYQNRSARTVGRTTGMFDTGMYETTIHAIANAMTGLESAGRAGPPTPPASGQAPAVRRQRSHASNPSAGQATRASSIAAAPTALSGKIRRSGIGSWGAE